MEQQICIIKEQLKQKLDTARFDHTLGVMYTAASLAMNYHTDITQALLAGLLHDCAKCIPDSEKIQLCKENGIEINDTEYQNPSLLHAKLGAYLAKEEYGIGDPNILSAIKWHTTGQPAMNLLEKIIYIADYIEPGRRELPNMETVRALAFQDIDECLYQILKDSLVYLNSKNIPIDNMTEETYHYYKKLLHEQEES